MHSPKAAVTSSMHLTTKNLPCAVLSTAPDPFQRTALSAHRVYCIISCQHAEGRQLMHAIYGIHSAI